MNPISINQVFSCCWDPLCSLRLGGELFLLLRSPPASNTSFSRPRQATRLQPRLPVNGVDDAHVRDGVFRTGGHRSAGTDGGNEGAQLTDIRGVAAHAFAAAAVGG